MVIINLFNQEVLSWHSVMRAFPRWQLRLHTVEILARTWETMIKAFASGTVPAAFHTSVTVSPIGVAYLHDLLQEFCFFLTCTALSQQVMITAAFMVSSGFPKTMLNQLIFMLPLCAMYLYIYLKPTTPFSVQHWSTDLKNSKIVKKLCVSRNGNLEDSIIAFSWLLFWRIHLIT